MTTGVAAATTDGDTERLRRWSQLTTPGEDQVRATVAALREAAGSWKRPRAPKRARPVRSPACSARPSTTTACTVPVIARCAAKPEHWTTTGAHAPRRRWRRLRAEASEAEQAEVQARAAREQARTLLLPAPAALSAPPVATADPGPALAAWEAWAAYPGEEGPAGLRKLADHIEQAWPPLRTA